MDRSNSTKPHDGLDDESTVLSLASSPTPSDFSAIEHDELANASVANSESALKDKMKSKLNPHPKYFFEDGNLLIRVENVDFKVHRYFFMRDSAPFRPLSKDGIIGRIVDDGMDATERTEPLVLESTTSLDFERFLSVLYPKRFDEHDGSSSDYWSSVLKVSTSLAFDSIRALSIKWLSSVATPVEKIALGREYGIVHWLREAYHDVCKRKETLTKEEGRRLGVDEVVGIMEARQILLWERPKLMSVRQRVLNRIFGLEPEVNTKSTDNDTSAQGNITGSGVSDSGGQQSSALESIASEASTNKPAETGKSGIPHAAPSSSSVTEPAVTSPVGASPKTERTQEGASNDATWTSQKSLGVDWSSSIAPPSDIWSYPFLPVRPSPSATSGWIVGKQPSEADQPTGLGGNNKNQASRKRRI